MTIRRDIEELVEKRLQPQKAVIVYGARRVGKTVLTQHIASRFAGRVATYNGEEVGTANMLSIRSASNYQSLFGDLDLLIVDEAQSIPEIGKVLKMIVDSCPRLAVLATGSSSFDLMQQVGEPLVGRAYYYQLFPLSCKETTTTTTRLEHLQHIEEHLIYGCYPELLSIPDAKGKKEYLKTVSQAYLFKDILAIDSIKNSAKLRQLLQLLAYQVGQEVSYEELARQLNLSRNTVERYINLLCMTFTIFRLPAFSRNPRREVVKPGKIYFVDNGIRNAIIDDFRHFSMRQDVGALWENYLIVERMKRSNNSKQDARHYFWRTYDGQEIDLVEETTDTLKAFEFKWGERMPQCPTAFAATYPDAHYEVINRSNYLSFCLE